MVAKASSPHVVVANVIALNFANGTTQLQAKMLMPFHLEDGTNWRYTCTVVIQLSALLNQYDEEE